MRTYYDVLGIPKTATKQEIRAAYRKLIRKSHTDTLSKELTQAEIDEATEKAILLNQAEGVLFDDDKRAKYDRQLADLEAKQKAEAKENETQQSGTKETVSTVATEEPVVREKEGWTIFGKNPEYQRPRTAKELDDLFKSLEKEDFWEEKGLGFPEYENPLENDEWRNLQEKYRRVQAEYAEGERIKELQRLAEAEKVGNEFKNTTLRLPAHHIAVVSAMCAIKKDPKINRIEVEEDGVISFSVEKTRYTGFSITTSENSRYYFPKLSDRETNTIRIELASQELKEKGKHVEEMEVYLGKLEGLANIITHDYGEAYLKKYGNVLKEISQFVEGHGYPLDENIVEVKVGEITSKAECSEGKITLQPSEVEGKISSLADR